MSYATIETVDELRCNRQRHQVSNLPLEVTVIQMTSQHSLTSSIENNKQENSGKQAKNSSGAMIRSTTNAQSSNEVNDSPLMEIDQKFDDHELNKKCLTSCLIELREDLFSEPIIVYLISKFILNAYQVEKIRAEMTEHDKNEKLVTFIQQLGPKAFRCFMESLKETNQLHIREKILDERKITGLSCNTKDSPLYSNRSDISILPDSTGLSSLHNISAKWAPATSIQDSLRELYIEIFRFVNPLSVPFAFDMENKWVPLTLKLEDNSTPTEDHADLINKALTKVKMLIIEGDPAAGKTSFLRRLAYEWAQKKSQLSHYDLVLYAEFREIWGQEFKSIIELVNCYMNSHLHKQDYEKFEHFIADDECWKDHKILVLLDGYDESSLEKQCHELKDYLFSNTISKPLRFNVVLTSRKGYLSKLRKQEGRIMFATVLGFTTELQKQDYISKHFDTEPPDIVTTLYNLVKTNENFKTLSEIPLMLTFICLVHNKIKDGTEVELYMNIIWWLLDRHQKDYPDRDVPALFGFQHSSSDKFRVIQDHYLHFPELHKLGQMAMLDIFKTTFTENDLDQFRLPSIVEQVGLLRKDEKRDGSYRLTIDFSFPHRTIQEFIMALTFFFSSEEPTKNFRWYLFDIGSVIANGIIQAKLLAFLKKINSTNLKIHESRKSLFSQKVQQLKRIQDLVYPVLRDQTDMLPMKWYQNKFRLKNERELGTHQVENEATALFTLDAEQADASARYYPEIMYRTGTGLPQSQHEAIELLRQDAEQGNADAQINLAIMYMFGKGVPKSYEETVQWCRKAAEQGHVYAQNKLGEMYYLGRGVAGSRKEAVKWFRKAAEQGYATGQFNLGLMYMKGEGVPQSDEESLKWFRKAAEQGHEEAQKMTGFRYKIKKFLFSRVFIILYAFIIAVSMLLTMWFIYKITYEYFILPVLIRKVIFISVLPVALIAVLLFWAYIKHLVVS